MANVLQRWRVGRRAGRLMQAAELGLGEAEALVDRGELSGARRVAGEALAGLEEAAALGRGDGDHLALLRARGLLLSGRAAEARAPAHRAASARPYDVDSRIVLGLVCLALDDLEAAGHEYASVLEEFGGDPDAERGRRAVALAQGSLPLEENLEPEDVGQAAGLLRRAWALAGVGEGRLAALALGGAEGEVLRILSGDGKDSTWDS